MALLVQISVQFDSDRTGLTKTAHLSASRGIGTHKTAHLSALQSRLPTQMSSPLAPLRSLGDKDSHLACPGDRPGSDTTEQKCSPCRTTLLTLALRDPTKTRANRASTREMHKLSHLAQWYSPSGTTALTLNEQMDSLFWPFHLTLATRTFTIESMRLTLLFVSGGKQTNKWH